MKHKNDRATYYLGKERKMTVRKLAKGKKLSASGLICLLIDNEAKK